MKKDAIYFNLEKNLQNLLYTLGEIVQLESPSHENKEISDLCCDYLENLWRDAGFRMERIHQDTCGDDLYGEYGEGEKTALILGHYDTVFPIGTIKSMPWKVEGDRAYGPGVLDMKGGIVMACYAVRALREIDAMPKGTVGIYLDANEESGSFCSIDNIVNKAKEYNCVLVMEPGVNEIGSVKTMRYGRGTYTVTAHGRQAHSGSNPHEAISPFLEIARQLLKIEEWGNFEKDATLAPVVIRGGIEGTCVIPETASFTMDVRFRTEEAMERVHEEIMNMKPLDDRYRLTVEGKRDKPIMVGDEGLLRLFEKAAADYDINTAPVICSGGSDGNFTAGEARVPTLDGLGMSGEFLHTKDEYINVNHIVRRTGIFAKLLQMLSAKG